MPQASLAQRLERSAVNRKVAGSIPAGGVLDFLDSWCSQSVREQVASVAWFSHRGYGATVARLTPDQTVGRSNRSGLIFSVTLHVARCRLGDVSVLPMFKKSRVHQSVIV